MTAQTISVSRSVSLPARSRDVWGVIGGFHEIDRWHPAVARCVRECVGDHEFRHLDLADGGVILEELLRSSPTSYTYRIVRSPLPVAHYEARLEVAGRGDESDVIWVSSFEPTGPEADRLVADIYETGFAGLRERFGA